MAINEKDICKLTSRLQILKLKLLKYNFNVEYLPGKNMYIADLLSRCLIKEPVSNDPKMLEVVHSTELELPIFENQLVELRRETTKMKC